MIIGNTLQLLLGKELPILAPPEIISSLQSIEVTNTDDGRDGFQLVFATGRSTLSDLSDHPLVESELLKPFSQISIVVILNSIPYTLINGMITLQELTPRYKPGTSTFTVTGEDYSVMMDFSEESKSYKNRPDTAIVSEILSKYTQFRLIPNIIPPSSTSVPLETERIPSQQGTDLEYILELAALHDYVFYTEPTDVPITSTAYWGPKNRTGKSQNSLSVNMGEATNVASINFTNNSMKPQIITGDFQDSETQKTKSIPAFKSSRPKLSKMAAVEYQKHVRTKLYRGSGKTNAQVLAEVSAMSDSSTDAITGTGQIDAFRYGDILRARNKVTVKGVGNTYGGEYYVKNVTHNIKRGEYTQQFTITREGTGSTVLMALT